MLYAQGLLPSFYYGLSTPHSQELPVYPQQVNRFFHSNFSYLSGLRNNLLTFAAPPVFFFFTAHRFYPLDFTGQKMYAIS